MREGVAKDGHNLYPAMPYPSYSKVSDEDISALYAYFMHGVAPVKQANLAPEIPKLLQMRWEAAERLRIRKDCGCRISLHIARRQSD